MTITLLTLDFLLRNFVMDTYERVRQSLIALLNDKDHKVVALRGKWGTGKTHLWRSLASNGLQGGKSPIYVSLFGVRSIKELKLRILQGIGLSDKTAFKKLVETGAGLGAGLIKRFTGYSAEDGILLWVSSLVKDRVIVIDDFERKHSTLHTDEVMGFLSDYSTNHDAQFLVLLNLEKLADEYWAALHEKVVDGEVVLDPSPLEAFDIAAEGDAGGYVPLAREACLKLNLINIRVIRKILRVLRLVSKITDAEHNAYDRWVPSTVLLVAIHYHAIENAPSLKEIRSFNVLEHEFGEADDGQQSDQDKKWERMLADLGGHGTDEYEKVIYSYLQTGLMDKEHVSAILTKYQKEQEQGNNYVKRREFFLAYWWDPSLSDADLQGMARQLSDQAKTLSPREISELVAVTEKVGDNNLARQILDKWLISASERPDLKKLKDLDVVDDFEEMHPEVQNILRKIIVESNPPLTLAEAVQSIIYGSWGIRETDAVENSTVEQYESTIRSLKLLELKNFLDEHVKWQSNQLGTDYFPTGTANFLKACKNILSTDPSGRLTMMIKRVFASRKKEILLQ